MRRTQPRPHDRSGSGWLRNPFDNYKQWRQASGSEADPAGGRFWTVPQFEIELIRAAGPDEGSWPPYDPDHPDNALPVLDIGKGSPTAVEFGDQSSFPPRYRNALYVLDWAYGRVLAVHLQPRGASYVAQAETFLQGQPLSVPLGFDALIAPYRVYDPRVTEWL